MRLLDNFRGRTPLWGRYFHCRHIAAQRLVPIQQLVMSRVRRIAKLGVLAGGTLSANRLEINRRKDGVLGLGTPRGSFLEQRYRRLTAARAMKDVNMQVRHDISPVVQASIYASRRKEGCGGNRMRTTRIAPRADEGSLSAVCASRKSGWMCEHGAYTSFVILSRDARFCHAPCHSALDSSFTRWPGA